MANMLVVDDEARYRQQIQRLLERENHVVETAVDGGDALDICRRFQPDVLIVDWMLRDPLNGLDLATLLHDQTPRLAIILITGYPATQLHEFLREREWQARVLEKPFELNDLRNLIAWALDARGSAENGQIADAASAS